MTNNLEDEIREVLAGMGNQDNQEQQTPQDEVQDIYVLIVREQEEVTENPQVVDSAPVKYKPDFMAFLPVCVFLLLLCSSLLFQLYCIMNPPLATLIIIPKSQTVTLSGTLQLGRVLHPITISQSQTTATTGKGHQSAKAATGTVTFYNGLFTQQFVASGTVYTGNDGVEIVTTQDATIPEGNPSSGYGTATVTAQAVEAGRKGNIQAGDVSITINNGLLVRNNQFHNGQDERTYTTVTQNDIHSISTMLTTSLTQSMQGALQGQLTPNEQLSILPCTPQVTSDHPIGAETIQVKVTVSQTCSAVAYNQTELIAKAAAFLATQARQKAGAGYSLFGNVQASVREASVTSTTHPLAFLSFHASGTWVYGLTHTAQEQIKHLIAGKHTQEARHLLASLPGVEQVSIRLTGFGDDTRLPKQSKDIHFAIIVM